MRFESKEACLAAAEAANEELRPEIHFAGKDIPVRFVGGKYICRGRDRWAWFPHLSCSACTIPPSYPISLLAVLTQQGMDAANFLRGIYHTVTHRPRPGDGAVTVKDRLQKFSDEVIPNGKKPRRKK